MRENPFVSLGKYWWNPFKGATKAVLTKEFSWTHVLLIFMLSHIARTVIELFSFSARFASLGVSLGAIFFIFLSLLLMSFVMYALMLSFLIIFFRRVVLPKRLLFLFATSFLPWVFVFPFLLLSFWMGSVVASLLSFLASLLSLLWLWELVKQEYALSGGKALIVLFGPSVVVIFSVVLRMTSFLVMLASKGTAWWL